MGAGVLQFRPVRPSSNYLITDLRGESSWPIPAPRPQTLAAQQPRRNQQMRQPPDCPFPTGSIISFSWHATRVGRTPIGRSASPGSTKVSHASVGEKHFYDYWIRKPGGFLPSTRSGQSAVELVLLFRKPIVPMLQNSRW
jgi:hypothetical protein